MRHGKGDPVGMVRLVLAGSFGPSLTITDRTVIFGKLHHDQKMGRLATNFSTARKSDASNPQMECVRIVIYRL
jgi:hypothetical protein